MKIGIPAFPASFISMESWVFDTYKYYNADEIKSILILGLRTKKRYIKYEGLG